MLLDDSEGEYEGVTETDGVPDSDNDWDAPMDQDAVIDGDFDILAVYDGVTVVLKLLVREEVPLIVTVCAAQRKVDEGEPTHTSNPTAILRKSPTTDTAPLGQISLK